MEEINDLIKQRIIKLENLKAKGINPYGGKFTKSININELLQGFSKVSDSGQEVTLAGRVMAVRSHGKSCFIDVKDSTAKIQNYIKDAELSEAGRTAFENLDIGDIVGIRGEAFKTRTGEPTVHVKEFTMLSKSIRPLPEKWHGLKDIETRYRQRYVDLIVNDDVKKVFELRIRMIARIRAFLDGRGFLEVETPMMQPMPGGAMAKPFKTHHEALGIDLYMRIAPELYLKRLLVGGFEKVYEINRNFRNEGISPRHNPEFTMIEAYQAYADCGDMIDLTEELILDAAQHLFGRYKLPHGGGELDLSPPWERIPFREAILKYSGIDYKKEKDLKKVAKDMGLDIRDAKLDEDIANKIFEKTVEPKLAKPTFIIDYPAILCPLSKKKPGEPDLTERFELFIATQELANAYSELNDPIEQKSRFKEQAEGTGSKMIDEDFVRALEYGMPPAGGLGIGIDRLAMLFADCDSIKDVILFPQLKPEQK
ncbi:MAG: lysine--tRNA ligase [Omnitrophica WOR_2 bacterium RIFCSPLOWO2_12_FULL_51_24]|nr:MAG: lysine--tRNA ligase [Omnitrophica WOR_2 bacterium RIFCSPLOWO2_02_FULL_50_19]OGX41560.1 MAG: lysine--tRNA ligase [Omnitrophica WOR_2 bacterium RIFCSPLOWO2_12_FULL_51_24]